MKTMKEVAIELARMKLPVFPCDASKQPLTPKGFYDASIDEATISKWWDKYPDALPAICPGLSHVVVIDLDVKNGHNGIEAFRQLCDKHNIDQSQFFSVVTPSKGVHLYFTSDQGFGNAHSLPDGIDVRSLAGYVIVPGAPGYEIICGSWDTVPALPPSLVTYLTPYEQADTPKLTTGTATRPWASEREKQIAENDLQQAHGKIAAAKRGTRRKTCNDEGLKLGHQIGAGWIERTKVEAGLFDAMTINGSMAEKAREVSDTIKRALDDGIKEPRESLPVWIKAEPWYRAKIIEWLEAEYGLKKADVLPSLFDFLENIRPLQTYDIPPVKYLVENMIPEGSIVMLSGGPGSGKSTLAMYIASLASEGLPIFGTPQVPCRTLYLDRDNPPPLVKERMDRLRMKPCEMFKYWGGHLGVDIPKRIFSDPEFLGWLDRDAIKPIVVVDSQIGFLVGKEDSADDIAAFYEPLRQLTNRGITVIVIHHTGKGESTKEFRGSSAILSQIDIGYVVNNSTKVGLNKLVLTAFKARVIVEEEIALNYVDGDFISQSVTAARTDNLTQLLRANPGITSGEFIKLAMDKKASRSDARNFIDTGVGFGTVLTRQGERNAKLLYLPDNVHLARSSS